MTHVMIVDDQQSNIEALAALLTLQGITHDSVMSSRQLAMAAHQTTYDIVFLDLEFPNDSGFEMLAQVRESFPGAQVVAYSVHTSEVEVVRQAGFDGFIGKPLSVSEFPGQIQRILAGDDVWSYA